MAGGERGFNEMVITISWPPDKWVGQDDFMADADLAAELIERIFSSYTNVEVEVERDVVPTEGRP